MDIHLTYAWFCKYTYKHSKKNGRKSVYFLNSCQNFQNEYITLFKKKKHLKYLNRNEKEKVWLDEEPRRLCLKRTQCFIWMWEDHFLSWGVGQWKQKVSRFGLDKFPRPFQLHYSIIVITWSQFHSWSKGKSFLHWHLLQVLFAWGLRVCVPAAQ